MFEKREEFKYVVNLDKNDIHNFEKEILEQYGFKDLSSVSKELIILHRLKLEITKKFIETFGMGYGDIVTITYNVYDRSEKTILSKDATVLNGLLIG
jgi:hypothetical protein